MRLRTTSPMQPGWTRRRAGRGFVYLDEHGDRLSQSDVERIKSLVIPPAWTDVWISPYTNGHLQAVGRDVAGRRQYLYHPDWRRKRDLAKFDRVLLFAKALPRARSQLRDHLKGETLVRERVLAAAVRLLDVGYFRIGNDVYADENGSFGLTTLERRHVTSRRGVLRFRFVGKSGIEHQVEVDDATISDVVDRLRRRQGGDDRLLAYKDGRRWRPVTADDVNDYLRELFAADVTAKDFRTWHATVLAAAALAAHDPDSLSNTARRRAVRAAYVEVGEYLGNTPAIAKSSYVDPRVVDLFEDGTTVAPAIRRMPTDPDKRTARLERAVLRMLV